MSHANDTCIQCHSQGQPLTNPIDGKYYDWPVGFHMRAELWPISGSWKSTSSARLTFTHFPDGTAHKNRMQGNDFVQSLMYTRGVTCFSLPRSARHRQRRRCCAQAGNVALPDVPRPERPERPARGDASRSTRITSRGQRGQPVRRLPHAEDRADDRRRQRAATPSTSSRPRTPRR